MFGFLFGAACLVGLIGVMKAGRHGGCHTGGRHHGFHAGFDGPRRRRRDFAAKAAGEVFKRKLDVDDEQEPIVDHAMVDLRAALADATASVTDAREALAAALRGPEVDDAAIAVAFARWDEALGKARRDALSAVKQIHAVLDDEQRAAAADWLAKGGPGWRMS